MRILQDLTLASRKDMAALLATPEPILTIEGTLEYQLCSETACHAPERLPVRWTVRVRPPETERVPEALRRK